MDSSLHHDPFAPDDAYSEPESWETQKSGEPVLDYDKGKAKDIIVFLSAAPGDVARRVKAYEAEHENRVTVLDAAQARLDTLEAMPHHENEETVAALRSAIPQHLLNAHNERKPAMFQKDRVLRAGATDDEANQLEAEYLASPAEAQQSLDDHLGGISESDIRGWLDDLRKAGHFSTEDPPAPGETPDSETGEPETVVETDEEKAQLEAAEAEAAAQAQRGRQQR